MIRRVACAAFSVGFIFLLALPVSAQPFRIFPRPQTDAQPPPPPPAQCRFDWCASTHPSYSVCTREIYYGSDILDCDDAAYLVCLQFPADQCWMAGFRGCDRDAGGDIVGHRYVILRRPTPNADGTWRFCAVEPMYMTEIHCWDSPSPNAPDGFPTDDIRSRLCGVFPWLDCACPTPIEMRPPSPGHEFDSCSAGEGPWYRCGSQRWIDITCRNSEGRIECLPPEMRTCLPDCCQLDGEDGDNLPGQCVPGEIKLCRNEEGNVRTRFCCESEPGSGVGDWCITPYETWHLPACSSLAGQSCDPQVAFARDCWDFNTPPSDLWGVRLPQSVYCRSCPGSPTGYCWVDPRAPKPTAVPSQPTVPDKRISPIGSGKVVTY